MFDRKTIHTVGTLSIASGAAVLILSLPIVFVGIADTVTNTTTGDALIILVQSVPVRESVFGRPQKTLSVGLLGIGVGCWLVGVGLVLQGRTER